MVTNLSKYLSMLGYINILYYWNSVQVSGNEENKEKMELARASLALASPLVGVIDKCVRVVNEEQLADIVPKLASHAKVRLDLLLKFARMSANLKISFALDHSRKRSRTVNAECKFARIFNPNPRNPSLILGTPH